MENNHIVVETENGTFRMEQELLALMGKHNLYNSLAATITAKIMDLHDDKIRASLMGFTGVEHRLEKVARVKGVDYINDSKATNVNSCWYALQSMTTPVVLILGGTDKGNDYSEIEELVKEKVHSLIFLGVDNKNCMAFLTGKSLKSKMPFLCKRRLKRHIRWLIREIRCCCRLVVPALTSSLVMRTEASSLNLVSGTCDKLIIWG